jgi:Ni/Co efflux regulator RcnB
MNAQSVIGKAARLMLVPILVAAVGVGVAQDRDNGHNNRGRDNGHDNGRHNGNDRNDNRDRGNRGNQRNDFHFRDQDRGRFESHYRSDLNRWRQHPQNRPRFARGQRIPYGYRIQPVPRSYYVGVAPLPPGYQYGYYDGYVVAYDPTTRMIGDVMDLVGTAMMQ